MKNIRYLRRWKIKKLIYPRVKKNYLIKRTLYLEFENDSILKFLTKFNSFNKEREHRVNFSKVVNLQESSISRVGNIIPEVISLSLTKR